MDKSCLIVGAGMAGLTAAADLRRKSWSVCLLDKGRGPGGRLATRRIGDTRFDHGAQFFTVRDPRFAEAVARWEQQGVVAPWFTDGHTRYRANAGMNALAKHMARDLDVKTSVKVRRIECAGARWRAIAESGESWQAGALLVTAPAPQAADLLDNVTALTATLRTIEYDPCFALMVNLDGASRVPPPGYARPAGGPVEWIADNVQKGIAQGPAALTIHARADFSRSHFDTPHGEVARLLLDASEPWFASAVVQYQLHRWRYSKPVDADRPHCLFTSDPAPLALAGDAFAGSRVEGAYLSGLAAAAAIGGTA